MKFYLTIIILMLQGIVVVQAQGKSPITVTRSLVEQGGPWYAIVLGRMTKPGKVSGTMAAYEASAQIASEKAFNACKKRVDMAECELVAVSKDCLFISVGTKDRTPWCQTPDPPNTPRPCVPAARLDSLYMPCTPY